MPSLGKYALIEQLGIGSMGTVYLAHDSILDREVALKTIRTSVEAEAEMRERFYREARTCARLQHPNIVTVFDLGEQDNFAYIAMELLTGSDFRKIVESRAQIDLISKVDSMIQICEALAYAHQQGIIHRDVKPSNLFLCENNRSKVLDFGIARLPSSRLTVAGRVLGTPNYMAPEQILGKPSDGRADLFSASVVFFEFLTYHHPFQSDLVPRRIVASEPDSLFDHASDIPLPLEAIFARGLAKDPDLRYRTGQEFAADLRAVADGLRQNSSPYFSKFPLPSLRAPVVPSPTDAPIRNPIDIADPVDTSLPRFLEALARFDSAVQTTDLFRADRILEELRSIAGLDERFRESLKISHEKISAVKHDTPSTRVPGITATGSPAPYPVPDGQVFKAELAEGTVLSPPAMDPGSLTQWIRQTVSATEATPPSLLAEKPESRGVQCDRCTVWNRVDASFCIGCGRSLVTPPKSATPVSSPKRGAAPTGASYVRFLNAGQDWMESRVLDGARAWNSIKGQTDRRSRIAAAGVVAVGIMVLLVIYLALGPKQIPIEAHVGTAVIQNREAKLLKSMSASASVLASLPRGATVNVLSMPSLGAANFWPVQPVVGTKVLSKGYVRGSALGNWKFSTPAAALAWAELLNASAGESGSDMESAVGAFHLVVTRFPSTQEAKTAAIEEAIDYLRAARDNKLHGLEAWRSEIENARSLAIPLLPDVQAANLLRQVNELAEPVEGPTPAPVPEPVASTEAGDAGDLARARQLKARYDYDGCIEVLTRFLKRHPGNSTALELLSDAQQARDIERGNR